MTFAHKVTKQFAKEEEKDLALFASFQNAVEYIQWCLEKDATLKVETIYRLYTEHNTVQKFSSTDIKLPSSHKATAQFKPTPLPMKPRPPGAMPYVEYPTEDENKNEDK